MRSHGIRYWVIRIVVRGVSAITAVVVGLFLVVGGFLAGLQLGHPLAGLALPLLGTVLALFVAQSLSSVPRDDQEDPFAPRTRTVWRLCDPQLRNTGVWRADVDSSLGKLVEHGEPALLRHAIELLVQDWAYRIGHYHGGRIVEVMPASAPKPWSASVPEHRSTSLDYRITVAFDGSEPGWLPRLATGWMHLGSRLAEFQLEPQQQLQDTLGPTFAVDTAKDLDPPRRAASDVPPATRGPMWDRWLDGIWS